jgi:hypothetical protein
VYHKIFTWCACACLINTMDIQRMTNNISPKNANSATIPASTLASDVPRKVRCDYTRVRGFLSDRALHRSRDGKWGGVPAFRSSAGSQAAHGRFDCDHNPARPRLIMTRCLTHAEFVAQSQRKKEKQHAARYGLNCRDEP